MWNRLRDVTGNRGMGFGLGRLLFWGFADRDVKLDWPCMLSCAVVMLALGLHDIAVGLSSLVDNGPCYILIICRGPKQHFLTGA